MSTYLVTGAAGFIASKVCEFLLADGHTVVGVDNLNDYYDVRLKDYRLSKLLGASSFELGADPKISRYSGLGRILRNPPDQERRVAENESEVGRIIPNPPGDQSGVGRIIPNPPSQTQSGSQLPGRFIFHHLDIENLPALEVLFTAHKFDAVFNLAARAGVRYSIEHPHVYLSTNILGTLNLLECQRKYGVKKHVLASSSSLYSGCPMPFTEDQPVNTPQSPYAATKKAAEMLAYSYHQLYGLDVSVLRYFTVFGPAGRPDMAPFRFIKWISEGTPITLYGDGTQARDFTYVDDIARGTILAVKPLGYEVINLGGGRNPVSLHTVINWIEKALNEVGRIIPNPPRRVKDNAPYQVSGLSSSPIKATILGQPAHAADLKETWADISKAKQLLDWTPQVTPEAGFKHAVEWHVANRDWLQGIKT